MSLAATRLALTHRATIQRATLEPDGWNSDGDPTWEPHLADLPCRAWATAGRETVANSNTPVVVEDWRMIVPLDTDVTENDHVTSVTDRSGTVLAAAQIRSVLRNQDHLELLLVRAA